MSTRYGSGARPALSPDGKWLVYATRFETKTGLVLRNLETQQEEWLAFPVQRDDMESRAPLDAYPGYSFTPDSKAIVVTYGGELWRVPVDKTAAEPDSLRGRSETRTRPRSEVRVQGGYRAHVYGATDPRRAAVARRQVARLHGARSRVRQWPSPT